jgi:hypothetical protein
MRNPEIQEILGPDLAEEINEMAQAAVEERPGWSLPGVPVLAGSILVIFGAVAVNFATAHAGGTAADPRTTLDRDVRGQLVRAGRPISGRAGARAGAPAVRAVRQHDP